MSEIVALVIDHFLIFLLGTFPFIHILAIQNKGATLLTIFKSSRVEKKRDHNHELFLSHFADKASRTITQKRPSSIRRNKNQKTFSRHNHR